MARVGIADCDWLPLVTRFGRLFHRVAGATHSLTQLARRGEPSQRHQFRPGRTELLGQR